MVLQNQLWLEFGAASTGVCCLALLFEISGFLCMDVVAQEAAPPVLQVPWGWFGDARIRVAPFSVQT